MEISDKKIGVIVGQV